MKVRAYEEVDMYDIVLLIILFAASIGFITALSLKAYEKVVDINLKANSVIECSIEIKE